MRPEMFYGLSEDRRGAFIIYSLQEVGNHISGLETQLKRIADILEKTDDKTKEEMLNKVKQALEE